LLERFHRGIYLDAFSAQREPLEAWLDHFSAGEAGPCDPRGYAFFARIALDERDEILGGITYELYPKSQAGLVTYMVVAPAARNRGLGRQLFEGAARALYDQGARAVFGEVNRDAPERLARFVRWGARPVDVEYVQPALGPGLQPDHGLQLIVLPPIPEQVDPTAFVAELHEVLSPVHGNAHRVR
jgi:GNAT superfamily N-acetyltransferase